MTAAAHCSLVYPENLLHPARNNIVVRKCRKQSPYAPSSYGAWWISQYSSGVCGLQCSRKLWLRIDLRSIAV